MPRTLLSQSLKPTNIAITIEPTTLNIPNSIQGRIETLWIEKSIEAAQKALNFYNGTSYRLNHWHWDGHTLQLRLAEIPFKQRYGLIVLSRRGEIDASTLTQGGCFVCASVETADSYFVVVKQSGKSALNENIFELLGGIAETDLPCDGGQYLFAVLYQELAEEANIRPEDIAECTLELFFAGIHGHFGFYFSVRLHASRATIAAQFKDNTDIDIDSLHFLTPDEYQKFLEEHSSPNKHLIAAHRKSQQSQPQ